MVARYRRPRRLPAVNVTAGTLKVLMEQHWLLPSDLVPWAIGAVMESSYSRPVALKQHLAVVQAMRTDLDAFFARVCTPQFCIEMFEDLCCERLLTRKQASAVQDCVLAQTDEHGKWKAARR